MGRGKVQLKFKFHPEHDIKAQRVSNGIKSTISRDVIRLLKG